MMRRGSAFRLKGVLLRTPGGESISTIHFRGCSESPHLGDPSLVVGGLWGKGSGNTHCDKRLVIQRAVHDVLVESHPLYADPRLIFANGPVRESTM